MPCQKKLFDAYAGPVGVCLQPQVCTVCDRLSMSMPFKTTFPARALQAWSFLELGIGDGSRISDPRELCPA